MCAVYLYLCPGNQLSNHRRHETSRPKEPDREFNGTHASNKTYDGSSASLERRILVLAKFVSRSRDERMKVIQSFFPWKCSALFALLESLLHVVVSSLLYLSSFPEHKVLSFRGGSLVSWRPSLTSLFFSVTQQTFFISNCFFQEERDTRYFFVIRGHRKGKRSE